MGLGTIIKRHKRTLINFQESFLLPFVTKVAHWYMQFEPELYPVGDYKFIASSSLGVVAREYEIAQLTQLLQTMGDDNPIKIQLTEAIIDNMNLSNREELLLRIQQASQSSPEEQQAAALSQQSQIAFQEAQTSALSGQAAESQARARKIATETELMPEELQIDRLKAVTTNLRAGTEDDKEFERRLKVANLLLKENAQTPPPNGIVPQQPEAQPEQTAQNNVMEFAPDGQPQRTQ